MQRSFFRGLQLLMALALALSGCAKRALTLQPVEPVDNPGGLRAGIAAPEIESEDIDGAVFKLSDYRGHVVLLDFWGNW